MYLGFAILTYSFQATFHRAVFVRSNKREFRLMLILLPEKIVEQGQCFVFAPSEKRGLRGWVLTLEMLDDFHYLRIYEIFSDFCLTFASASVLASELFIISRLATLIIQQHFPNGSAMRSIDGGTWRYCVVPDGSGA